MSGFLDQAEIDKLQQELSNLNEKKAKANSAKEKIKIIYLDVVKNICPNNMDNMEEIGVIINDINLRIDTRSKYYDSFIQLKYKYSNRI